MAEETHTPPGPGMMVKPTATSNSTNCISSSSSSSLDNVRDGPRSRSEPSGDEASTGLGVMARLAFDSNVTGSEVGQGTAAKASTTGSSSSSEHERGVASTGLVPGGLPAGSMPSKSHHQTLYYRESHTTNLGMRLLQ